MKPIILIAPEHVTLDKGEALLVREEYVEPFREAGAVVLGAGCCKKAEEYAKYADALVLSGGCDVHSSRYGQYDRTFQELMRSDTKRDDMDFALCRAFRKAGKPILGIGRGAQVINVVLGGTLIRDLPGRLIVDGVLTEQPPGSYVESNRPLQGFGHGYGIHCVDIVESALLGANYSTIRVNSFHHQTTDQLGEGLKITATAPDGAVEAFEHITEPIFGVLWHPEHAYLDYEPDSGLFKKFVEIAKRRAPKQREDTSFPVVTVNGGPAFDKTFETAAWIVNKTYVSAMGATDGLPVLAVDVDGAKDYAQISDGLLMTGTFSWSPREGLQIKLLSEGSQKRDLFDEALFQAFMGKEKPIFGICLGEQLINQYLGGSLVYNFKFRDGHEHMMSEHEIQTVSGSVLHRLFGERFWVNSRHNNRVQRLAPGLKVTAVSDDGIIEAVEHETLPIYGVQFHPERMRGDIPDPPFGPDTTPLFVWFTEKCQWSRRK